jgi:hypothetical protein
MKHFAGSAPHPKMSLEQATLDAPDPTKAILTSLIFLPAT